ncbi:transposase [Paenibacillus oceani]|uniref:transposase n=1 Tax=Paenibacillus oceani TaxID=2772510 RepID=UPI0037C747E0
MVFLPPCSPNLNPADGLWLWLKTDVVNNVFFEKFYKTRIHGGSRTKGASLNWFMDTYRRG